MIHDYVKCYWQFDNSTNKEFEFTILPDGCFDLIISLDNHSVQSISLTGLWTKQIDVLIAPNTFLFAVRFKLLAAEYLLQLTISKLLNTELVLQNDFWQLDSLHFKDKEAVVEVLNNLLLSKLGNGKGIDSRKQNLFNLLYDSNGNLTVEEYSKNVSWPSRQINRYFNERFGLSLKAYSNILRCFASYRHIKNGQLYPQQNYFDQSHFIKQIVKHTGQNPSELHQNKNDRFLQLATMVEK